jgi:hypothetical protein
MVRRLSKQRSAVKATAFEGVFQAIAFGDADRPGEADTSAASVAVVAAGESIHGRDERKCITANPSGPAITLASRADW